MGLTPLGGIMMGTRTGDMDPSVMNYICKQTHTDVEKVNDMLNKQSGFLGVSGISSDTRDVEEAYLKGNSRAKLAIELFTRRVLDYIGQYYVRLGGVYLIAFTAGIGENASIKIAEARKKIEKEQKHYANALQKVIQQLATASADEIAALEEKKKEMSEEEKEFKSLSKTIICLTKLLLFGYQPRSRGWQKLCI